MSSPSPPRTPPPPPPTVHRVDECPSCGASRVPDQEYCVECGRRLPTVGLIETASPGRTRGRAGWLWPSLASFIVAVLATTGVLAVRAAGDSPEPVLVATTEPGASVPTTVTAPTVSVPSLAPEPVLPRPTTTTSTSPPRPVGGGLAAWPSGRSGFTVVLASMPASAGQTAATGKARDAVRAGLPRVGVLESSRYASLHPGYLVVFSGVYGSMEEAASAVQRARAVGYDAAYAREIAS